MSAAFPPSNQDDSEPEARLEQLRRVDRYLNTAPLSVTEAVEVGPFTLFLNRETDQPYASYARPTSPLPPDPLPAIRAVQAEFARRGRVCRWEFLFDLWPELPASLVRAGFSTPERHPLMLITPDRFRPEALGPGVTVRRLSLDDDPRPLLEAAHAAFGMGEQAVEPGEVENLHAMMRGGLRLFAAWTRGNEDPVTTGAHLPIGDTTEVAGIATAPPFQRRGLGGQVTSAVVADAFAAGCACIFLTAGDAPARRLYARLGFEEVGVGMSATEEPSGDVEIL